MIRVVLMSCLALVACKNEEHARPMAPASPKVAALPAAEPAAAATADAGDAAIANAAAYEAKATELTDKLLELFAVDGANCDKLATDLTAFVHEHRATFARLRAFEQAHPEAERAFDDKMQAREQELDAKLGPAFDACKGHEGLAAALDALPRQ